MRGWVIASWVAVGLLLLSGAASAHPAGTMVTAEDGPVADLPAQSFDDAFCLPMCTTQARQQGNVPPVIVTESGTTLTWKSLGTYHTTTSDTETGVDQDRRGATLAFGQDTDGQACLDAPFDQGSPVDVLFEIGEDGLHVTDFSFKDPSAVHCDEAGSLPDGSYLLKIHCDVHPTYQHQLIHVVPAGTV